MLTRECRLDEAVDNSCAFTLSDLAVVIEFFRPHCEGVPEAAVGDEVHLVENVLLRFGVCDALSKWLKSGAEVVAALLVDDVSNVLGGNILSCLVRGVAVSR